MTDAEKAANKYAWEHTNDPTMALKLARAFEAGANWERPG